MFWGARACMFLTRSKIVGLYLAWGARPLIVALSDKIFLKGGGYLAFPFRILQGPAPVPGAPEPSRLLLVLYIGVGIGVLRLAGSVGPIDPLTTADLGHQIRLTLKATGGLRPIDPHTKGVSMQLIRLDSLAARGSIRTDPHAGEALWVARFFWCILSPRKPALWRFCLR